MTEILEGVCWNCILVFLTITVVCLLMLVICGCIDYIDDYIKGFIRGKKSE